MIIVLNQEEFKAPMTDITITRPDDWHLHLRDGDILKAVLPFTAELYGRAIIMPNLKPPLRKRAEIVSYRDRIINLLPHESDFQPLMTLYLTDETTPVDIRSCMDDNLIAAVKLYPVGATTNAEHGVTDIKRVYPVLEFMQEKGLPLSVHGETSDPDVDVFDREAVFIERNLAPLRNDFPELKVVFEHLTSKIGVDYVLSGSKKIGATITPHHLLITRNDIFRSGIRPHMYCLPIAKKDSDRTAVRKAATSGDSRFFFGSDSAPHQTISKIGSQGAAGIFNVPTAVSCVTQVFEEESALDKLEGFLSVFGPRFYGLPVNADTITLQKSVLPVQVPPDIRAGNGRVEVFRGEEPLHWSIVKGQRSTATE